MPRKKKLTPQELAEEAVRQAIAYVNELYDKYGADGPSETGLEDEALQMVGRRFIELRKIENAAKKDK